ncbi:unnamed protein product [Phyllotreta striolata]|uniref:Uncharacterized protein n=1 Tax=Phyllotreta striolata TaxID=444603 RepID=A0A9N9TTS5_PHYSR|nr:unnamed protein product [Phyllotreta striolata]
MKKNLSVDQALSILTPDQLKVLGMQILKHQTSTFPSKLTSSHAALPIPSSVAGCSTKQQSQRSSVPSTSKSIVDQSKKKMSVPASLINSMSMNLQSASQLFREPANKVSSPQDDKSAKDLLKGRPNISITPVSLSPTPNFMKKTSTSPSSGKTLQRKLVSKKKVQQNNQLKSTLKSLNDSGVLINQISANSTSKGKTFLSTNKKQIDPVVLMPINKKANSSIRVIRHNQKNPHISKKPATQISSSKISSETQKKSVAPPEIKLTAQKAEATPSSTSRTNEVVRIQTNPDEITLTKNLEPLLRGEISIEVIPKTKSNTKLESIADDDVICID